MSCIDVSVRRVGKDIAACVTRIGKGLEVTTFNLCEPLRIAVESISKGLKVTCGLVCSSGQGYYLRVEPDVVWLTPDALSSADFNIYSNVTWKIINTGVETPYLDVSRNQVWIPMNGGSFEDFDIYSNVVWKID